MQKATFTVRPGLIVEVEAATQLELFAELASAAEVFGEAACGLCGCKAVYPIHRHSGKYEFEEWACPECGARLSMGRTMEGGRLFPVRALTAEGKPDREHGTRGTHRGWTKYRGESNGDGPRTPVPAKRDEGPKTPTPGYRPPTRAEAGAPISAQQWDQLKTELAARFISPAAFLACYGYQQPRDILARDFDALLRDAKNPPDQLRACQKQGKFGRTH